MIHLSDCSLIESNEYVLRLSRQEDESLNRSEQYVELTPYRAPQEEEKTKFKQLKEQEVEKWN